MRRQFPQHAQFRGPGRIVRRGQRAGKRVADAGEMQVGGHRHALDARFLAHGHAVVRDIHVQRQRRAVGTGQQRECADHLLGQHRDLAPRHVDGGQAVAGDRVQRVARHDAQRGRRDVDADARMSVRQLGDRKCVIDLRGRRVVDRKGADRGHRQVGQRRQFAPGGIGQPLGERAHEKLVEMVIVRRGNRPAGREQRHRTRLLRIAGRGQRLPLQRVLVGLVQQHRQPGAQRVGQLSGRQIRHPGRHLLAFAPLAFDRRQRRFQRLGRRLAVTTLAALVEIHRRPGERERDSGTFHRRRRVADIVGREFGETEFVVTADFPQEIDIHRLGKRARLGLKRRRRRRGEAQQHGGGLHLHALPGGRLDLQRCVVVGEDGTGLELAVVLEKDVHGIPERMSGCARWRTRSARECDTVAPRGKGADYTVRRAGSCQGSSSEPNSSAASCSGRKNWSDISCADSNRPCRMTLIPAT